MIKNKLFQYSTISSLLAGNFDGEISFKKVMKNGNFGIGTFDALDGELIAFDNKYFKLTSEGEVIKVQKKWTTPFVSVTNFKSDYSFKIDLVKNKVDLLNILLEKVISKSQYVYGIKIKGTFDVATTRTVKKQEKPFKGLLESTKEQKVYNIDNTTGTVIGFFTPKFLNNIGVESLHIHYINDSFTVGGHLFEFDNLKNAEVEIAVIKEIDFLIGNNDFKQENLQDAIREAEK